MAAASCSSHPPVIPASCLSSSGSHHDPSLRDLVHHFLHQDSEEEDESDAKQTCHSRPPPPPPPPPSDLQSTSLQLAEILQRSSDDEDEADAAVLRAEVHQAMEDLQVLEGSVDDGVRRAVMSRLRHKGYNAAICKSKWNHAPGIPAGDYEYMDVVMKRAGAKAKKRYIVDLEFRAQFEIARASEEYRGMMTEVVGRVFVGGVERLKAVVRAMCAAAKTSLRQQGLHLPPWRKPRYMLCKWCAAYRRTTSPSSSSSPTPPPASPAPPPPSVSASDLQLGLEFPAPPPLPFSPTLHTCFSSSDLSLLPQLQTRKTTGFQRSRRLPSSSSHSNLPDLAAAIASNHSSPPVAPPRTPPSALSAALKLHASSVVAVLS